MSVIRRLTDFYRLWLFLFRKPAFFTYFAVDFLRLINLHCKLILMQSGHLPTADNFFGLNDIHYRKVVLYDVQYKICRNMLTLFYIAFRWFFWQKRMNCDFRNHFYLERHWLQVRHNEVSMEKNSPSVS